MTRRGVAEGDFDRSVASSSLRYCSLTPLQRVTWRRNERPDGDVEGYWRGNGEGEGLRLRKCEGEAYPRRHGDQARGGLDKIGAAMGVNLPVLPLKTEALATD